MSYYNISSNIDNAHVLWLEKVGYDSANKKMMARIAYALHDVVYFNMKKPNWSNVVRYMFELEGNEKGLKKIAINGYYGTIRAILKDIDVIRYKGKTLKRGKNWDRFFDADTPWDWFITSTNGRGWGEIIK